MDRCDCGKEAKDVFQCFECARFMCAECHPKDNLSLEICAKCEERYKERHRQAKETRGNHADNPGLQK